eukprot:scaffold207549_cov32-Tisochrysis_lutea.AAC.3
MFLAAGDGSRGRRDGAPETCHILGPVVALDTTEALGCDERNVIIHRAPAREIVGLRNTARGTRVNQSVPSAHCDQTAVFVPYGCIGRRGC